MALLCNFIIVRVRSHYLTRALFVHGQIIRLTYIVRTVIWIQLRYFVCTVVSDARTEPLLSPSWVPVFSTHLVKLSAIIIQLTGHFLEDQDSATHCLPPGQRSAPHSPGSDHEKCSSFATIRSRKVLLIRQDQIMKSAPHSPRLDPEKCSSFARIRSWKVLLIRHDQIQKSAPHSPRSDQEKCSSFATTRSRKVLLICHDQIKKSAADYQIEEAASILPPPHNQNATHCPPPGRRSASKSTLPPSDCELATHCPPPGRRSATVLTAHFQIKEMLKNVQLQVEGVPQCSLPTSR